MPQEARGGRCCLCAISAVPTSVVHCETSGSGEGAMCLLGEGEEGWQGYSTAYNTNT